MPEERMAIVLDGSRDRNRWSRYREHQISQAMFYRWRDRFLEAGQKGLTNGGGSDEAEKLRVQIKRLRQTGNPKALQHHLGYSSISMVLRYLSTLSQEDSLRIQQRVKFK